MNQSPAWLLEIVLKSPVASFPGRSRLQFLIAYCMQKRRGKAWVRVSLTGVGEGLGTRLACACVTCVGQYSNLMQVD